MKHSYMKLFAGALVVLASALTANADQTVYFEDNFDWMQPEPAANIKGWETTNELGYVKWNEDQLSHGYTSYTNWAYMRPGFFKLGKTGYSGDLVTPAMTAITDTKTVKVSFQAVGYTSAKSKQDANDLYVVALGAGKVTKVEGFGGAVGAVTYVDPQTADLSSLVQYADGAVIGLDKETGYFDPVADSTALQVWQAENTKYIVTIEGATSSTRIAFVGGPVSATKLASTDAAYLDRVFIDNLKVYGEGSTPEPTTKGDVNGDGKVDTSDISSLMAVILNNGTATDNPKADVNEDGKVDTTDLSVLISIILAA